MHNYISALKNVCIYRYLVTVVTTMLGYLCPPGQCKSPSPGPPELSIIPSANDYLRGQGHYWCIHLRPGFITGNHRVDTGTSCLIGFIGLLCLLCFHNSFICCIGLYWLHWLILASFATLAYTGFIGFICYIGLYWLHLLHWLILIALAYTGFIGLYYIGLYWLH